jgi:hypothetical protein
MAVQYINGQLYDIWQPSMANINNPSAAKGSSYQPIYATGRGPVGTPIGQANLNQGGNMPQQGNGMFGDPFGTAMSGGVSGTLQPFVNRNTQMANNALYGGLLGYQPQQLKSGDAGGTPVDPTPPQWRLPSAIPNANQAQVGLLGPQAENYNNPQPGIFGNRAWMEY